MTSPQSRPLAPHTLTSALCSEHQLKIILRVSQGDVPQCFSNLTAFRTRRGKTSHMVNPRAVLLLRKTLTTCILSGKNKNRDCQAPRWQSKMGPRWPSTRPNAVAPVFTPGWGPAVRLLRKKPRGAAPEGVPRYSLKRGHEGDRETKSGRSGGYGQNLFCKEVRSSPVSHVPQDRPWSPQQPAQDTYLPPL